MQTFALLAAGGGLPLEGTELNLVALILVPLLLLLNAFFVAAEFSLVAVRRTQVDELVQQGVRGAGVLQAQVRQLDHYIAATQLGITISSIGLGWVAEPAVLQLIQPLFGFLDTGWQVALGRTLSLILAFTLVTILHVAASELAPKAIALQRPLQVALRVAYPLMLFTRATRFLVLFMNALGNGLVRLLGFRAIPGGQMVHSVEELTMIVDEVEGAGLLSPEQAEYVQNVFMLTRKRVRDCMVPRDKMAALELHTPPEKVLDAVRQGAHTRMPVYEGELDNIVGIVNTKDLFHLFSLRGVVVLHDAVYPAIFLKPDQPLDDAMLLFRRARRPMAIVRDEEGRVLGMITLEDVIEEIIGDIEDEHDRPLRRVRLIHRAEPGGGRRP